MFSLNEGNDYVLCVSSVNMRNGVEGLCGLVRYCSLSPTNGHVYIFVNKSRTLLKLLHWERGGYVIYYKRLEQGRLSHRIFLKNGVGFRSIRWDELVLLMEGINPNIKRRKRCNLEKNNSFK